MRVTLAVTALGTLALAAGGCGGRSVPSVANLGTTPTWTTQPFESPGGSALPASTLSKMVEFSECMRAHGVVGFPDPIATSGRPTGAGNSFLGNGPDPSSSPVYRSASRTCQKYATATRLTPSGAARVEDEQRTYAHSMRSHGVTVFPDPGTGGGFPNAGIDERTPIYRAAARICARVLPGALSPPGVGAG